MGKIIYREFLGNRLVLLVLFASGIGIPIGILYLIEYTVTVAEDVESPSEFLASRRQRPAKNRWVR